MFFRVNEPEMSKRIRKVLRGNNPWEFRFFSEEYQKEALLLSIKHAQERIRVFVANDTVGRTIFLNEEVLSELNLATLRGVSVSIILAGISPEKINALTYRRYMDVYAGNDETPIHIGSFLITDTKTGHAGAVTNDDVEIRLLFTPKKEKVGILDVIDEITSALTFSKIPETVSGAREEILNLGTIFAKMRAHIQRASL